MNMESIVIDLVGKVSNLQARVDIIQQIGIALIIVMLTTLFTNIWQLVLIKKNGNGHVPPIDKK
jgi:hypothetical protein